MITTNIASRFVRIAILPACLLAGCGRHNDQDSAEAANFVPPVVQAPTPIAGQRQTTPLSAYVGHYPGDAVDGVSFFDRTEVANALVEVEPDERLRKSIVSREATTVPIVAKGTMIAAHGCEAHDCSGRNWTLFIAADGDREQTAICVHDATVHTDSSRWTTRAGSRQRAGDCPQA